LGGVFSWYLGAFPTIVVKVKMSGSANNYLQQLNEKQRSAVIRTEGPTLVLAGAGSGKTRTITYKIAHLIEQGISKPEQILAVTFTNKAANEMRSRVEQLSAQFISTPLVCTFHSFAVRVLRRHADMLGYQRNFMICDREDQKRVLKTVYKELELTDSQIPLNKALAAISHAKNNGHAPEDYLEHSQNFEAEEIFRIYEGYQRFLKQSNAMDFDDLILLTVNLFSKNQDVKESYGDRYKYLLIDEYQDTNRPQYELIKHLTCLHQNLTAVGDEDQSIYAFRGADIGNILRFETDYPGSHIIKLEQNYRSTQNILDAAIGVVENNVDRKGKTLWTDVDAGELIDLYVASNAKLEAMYVSEKCYEHLQREEHGLAILYRTNFQSRQFEEALRRLKVPYNIIGGVSFYHRKEIKDSLAYLRLAQNPEDNVSLLRVINQPPRGIGQVTLDRLQKFAQKEGVSLWVALQRGLQENSFPGRTHLVLDRFYGLLQELCQFMDLPFHLALEKILEKSGYAQALRDESTEQSQSRILNLEELITVAREYSEEKEGGLQDFLDHAALRSEADDYDESAAVSLMTLHNAKGLEFFTVFVVGCEEGLFPHSRSVVSDELEEERRLCYVGLTRAKSKLYLTYSQQRRFYGRDTGEQNFPSRFLNEIPQHLIRKQSSGRSEFGIRDMGANTGENRYRRLSYKKKSSGATYNSVESARDFLEDLSRKRGGLVAGAKVFHKEFGYGRVLQVQKSGDDLKVTVKFGNVGIKKILQSYAKLTVV